MDDIIVLVLVVFASACVSFQRAFWPSLSFSSSFSPSNADFFTALEKSQLQKGINQPNLNQHEAPLPPLGQSSFMLSDYSLPICRSLWRIVEYVVADFIDFWYLNNISDNPEFPNDIRDMLDHIFNVLGERCLHVKWEHFFIQSIIQQLHYLLRIHRLTELDLHRTSNDYVLSPPNTQHALLQQAIVTNYKLHVGVSSPLSYMRKLSVALLSRVLRPSDFQCDAARSLCRELMAKFIFMPIISFAQPYWINVGLHKVLREKKKYKEEKLKREPGGDRAESATQSAATAPASSTAANSSAATADQSNGPMPSSLISSNSSSTVDVDDSPSFTPSTPPSQLSLNSVSQLSLPSATQLSVEAPSSPSQYQSQSDSHTQPSTDLCSDPLLDDDDDQYRPHRKESLLTQKMKEWSNEKQKRHAHKEDRKLKHQLKQVALQQQQQQQQQQQIASLDSTDSSSPPSNALSNIPSSLPPPATTVHIPPSHMLSSHWEVRIIGAGIHFDPKPYVIYQLQVINGIENEGKHDSIESVYKWQIVKRFQKFEELHNKLKKSIPSFDAQLPKKHFFGNLDQNLIQSRKVELQTYLGQLLWNRSVQASETLKTFLLPSEDDYKWYAANGIVGKAPSSSAVSISSTPPTSTSASSSGSGNSVLATSLGNNNAANKSHPLLSTSATFSSNNSSSYLQNAINTIVEEESMFSPQSSSTTTSINSTSTPLPTSSSSTSLPESPQKKPTPSLSEAIFNPHGGGGSTISTDASSTAPFLRSQSAIDVTSNQNNHPSNTTHPPHLHTSKPTVLHHSHSFRHSKSKSNLHLFLEDKSITDPLYLLIEEIFNLNGRGWVRRQATWVTKQIVKITADKLIKNMVHQKLNDVLNEDQIVSHIDWLTSLIWPNGVLFKPAAQPTGDAKEQLKTETRELLIELLPSALRTLLGREHTEAAVLKCFQFLQMEPLIQHFAYSVLDSLILELFPDLVNEIGK